MVINRLYPRIKGLFSSLEKIITEILHLMLFSETIEKLELRFRHKLKNIKICDFRE